MNIADPAPIATDGFTWQQRDGTEVAVQVMIGTPYRDGGDWACPAALYGIDGRYADIIGGSALQAACLAIRLVHARLAHLLDAGEVLLYPGGERLDAAGLAALFGR
jgi:hypothetical protein